MLNKYNFSLKNIIEISITTLFIISVIGCVPSAKLNADIKVLKQKIESLKRQGAYKCAPRELAVAETETEFGFYEYNAGEFLASEDHLTKAKIAVNKAAKLSKGCLPKRVLVKVEPKDTDGDGIVDSKDSCPTEPEDFDGFQDEDGCPEQEIRDSDGDGIINSVDKCPIDPEDIDKYKDEDGCPDPDNDNDQIIDLKDSCPMEPEDYDDFMDKDGCPDPDNDKDGIADASDNCPLKPGPQSNNGCPAPKYKLIVVTEGKIELKQKVFFSLGKSVIKPVSFPLLNEVADVMKNNKNMEILIEGHTDSTGRAELNLKLSDARANSVMLYLTEQEINPDRMQAMGYGKTKPIEDNRTKAGRDKNRRVEFKIIKR